MARIVLGRGGAMTTRLRSGLYSRYTLLAEAGTQQSLTQCKTLRVRSDYDQNENLPEPHLSLYPNIA